MIFEVGILGSSSATPIYQRHPTAQVINFHERFFLIDCGEGTLIQMNRYKIKFHRINHIFISHLHGDHYLGLLGLISTMHLQGRVSTLHIHGPQDLKEIIDIQLKYSETTLRYPVEFHSIDPKNPSVLYDDEDVTISSIILSHRIPCTGFLFTEKPRQRKLKKDKLAQFNIPVTFYNELKAGKDYIDEDGKTVPNSALTIDPRKPRRYEATFLSDKADRAKETFHSTAAQAATIAKEAGVRRLIIGHFSARYKNLYPLLEEAKSVFPETTLAIEGDRFSID